ncbi:MAG: NAD(P)-dependent glycerol-3-phosphate dehydrogenase [Acidobacteriota bacterium]|nr:NAD(P)-dependent glycerol-3-phosphate dehydrogenase [Acidobacteriota bacterium]
MSEIAIVGAGAWGTALAIVLGRKGSHRVHLWAHESAVLESVALRHVNEMFLPQCPIPESVSASGNVQDVLKEAEIVVSAMPSQHCRSLFQRMCPFLKPEMKFVSATKGLEESSLLRMTEVITSTVTAGCGFQPCVGALSGPSFAAEVARGDPTAITIASRDVGLAKTVQREFGDPRFRIYTNNDVIGVELGGALKNIIAISAGICDGLGLGHNSVAALITRGLAEITRLSVACGGRQETMAGLAGLGDLVLTCTGGLSRNRSVGFELGRGRRLPEIIAEMHGMVAEGVLSTKAAIGLARAHGVEMPIADQMYALLYEHKSPADAIHSLMTRTARSEISL